MGAGLVTWWMDRPWWLRWMLCLTIFGLGFFDLWLLAIGGVLTIVNVFLSWNEIMDHFMGPRK